MMAPGWHVDVVAVCKDGSEMKCSIIGNSVRGFRCQNGSRPWKFHIAEADRQHINDERMQQLIYACAADSIYGENERVVFA